jgi:FkbM family methyltransferase
MPAPSHGRLEGTAMNGTPRESDEPSKARLIVYGYGNRGRQIVDQLLASGHPIDLIVDRDKHGTHHKSIPVRPPSDLKKIKASDFDCLIALHNHYTDIHQVHEELRQLGFRSIKALAAIDAISPNTTIDNGYWLDPDFDYKTHDAEIEEFLSLLEDRTSREIAHGVLRYRKTGEIGECPRPSPFDTYTPIDLPRYKDPLRLVDCGAHTGTAIEAFEKAKYRIESFVAFEPDLENFKNLSAKSFNVDQPTLLPLGTWSSNSRLRFSSNGDMSSSVNAGGDQVIQCVKLDDAIPDFAPNVIKLDVEGAEFDTLIGAEKIIRTFKPNLCVSTYHTPHDFFRIGLLINSWRLNYQFHFRVHEFNTFGSVLYCLQEDKLARSNAHAGVPQ